MSTVELHTAFMWDCPECGRENFTRAIACEMTPDELAEAEAALESEGIGMEVGGGFVAAPKEVTCQFCNQSFDTEDQL